VQDFDELRELMKTDRSYGDYRQELQDAPPPKIPYIGVYLSDLVFIEDGNKDVLQDQINFHKRFLIWKTLQEIALYQSERYRFPALEPLLTIVQSTPSLPERDLYALSLRCEVRGCLQPPN
jgi:RasGEF domain